MNNFKIFICVILVLALSKSYAFSKDFIGVISAGIGEIINQDNENSQQVQKFILEIQ